MPDNRKDISGAELRALYEKVIGDRRESYRVIFGAVPEKIDRRWAGLEAHGRTATGHAVNVVRQLAILESPLGLRIQQLVQFGQLIALGRSDAALLHARAALHAGATLRDLLGVAETALISAGVPGYSLGADIVALLTEEQSSQRTDATEEAAAGV